MPFILICGFPSSGKSKRAEELKNYLEQEHKKSVTVISDHNTGVNRNEVYEGTSLHFTKNDTTLSNG